MAIYKVLFHPLEEYFFGEDGSFREGVSNAEYFITSRFFPSQTTIFGIIRYLNLVCLKDKGSYSSEEKELNSKAVGGKGFCIESATGSNSEFQNFGIIKGISSVFLHRYDVEDKVSKIYVTLPRDAKKQSKIDENKSYTSIFDEGEELAMNPNGKKTIPLGYNAKEGLASGFISIDAGISDAGKLLQNELSVVDSPFEYVLKTGLKINRKVDKPKDTLNLTNTQDPMSSLFKKEYIRLKQEPGKVEYSFGVYVEIQNHMEEVTKRMNRVVGMGLGGSLFSVRTSKIEEIEKKRLKNGLILNVDKIFDNHVKKENVLYCISPCYVSNPQDILMKSKFASLDTVVNRPMSGGGINDAWRKTKTLYRMIDSGSILMMEHANDIVKEFQKKGLQQIGYNHYYLGGEI